MRIMQIKRKRRNSLSTKNNNTDREKLRRFPGFVVTVVPGEQEDPILTPKVGSLILPLVVYHSETPI